LSIAGKLYGGGPCPIFGRGHCGGRILSEAYHRSGIYMGRLNRTTYDTVGMGLRYRWMKRIARGAYRYPTATREEREELERLLARKIEALRRKAGGRPFGWKVGSSIFCIEILLTTYPRARAVHLIRDGRDVCLSRLDARLSPRRVARPENRIAVFGRADVTDWKGVPLKEAVRDDSLRNELEMLHWKTATEFGLRGRAFPAQYLEVRYEDLCQRPVEIMQRIFEFIEVPMGPEVRRWAEESVHAARIGKWKDRKGELKEVFRLGEPTLTHLGYA
jgi:hypothetical protein